MPTTLTGLLLLIVVLLPGITYVAIRERKTPEQRRSAYVAVRPANHNGMTTAEGFSYPAIMDSDAWGRDDPPLMAVDDLPPLPPRLLQLANLGRRTAIAELDEGLPERGVFFESPSPNDLPEVALLAKQGWRVAPDEPFLAFLPAVWPAEHRGWIHNRVPSVWICDGPEPSLALSVDRDGWIQEEGREDYPANLEGTGIPVPPLGRIWLLRSPFDGVTVSEIKMIIVSEAERRAGGDDIFLRRTHLVDAARNVLSWDTDAMNAWRRTAGEGQP